MEDVNYSYQNAMAVIGQREQEIKELQNENLGLIAKNDKLSDENREKEFLLQELELKNKRLVQLIDQ